MRRRKKVSYARFSGILAALLLLGLTGLGGCKEEGKLGVASRVDPKKMPSMSTVNVSTLISDSGITQYKIVSPLWTVYDEVDTPYWSFPKGIYLQKFDRQFNVIASVAADSAKFFRLQNLWKLDGNVELKKEPGELFLTQQLFWDQRRSRLYSDSFIHIETPDRMLEGHGFESNDRLTKYSIRRPTGIFPVSEDMRR
ncbi:MAG: LPS export ABC transporter periplasmic protein LptC [Bacteroides sp.]|nr:LPS export ABC transporter periplasmic protein LptC [Bacteroides sp.]